MAGRAGRKGFDFSGEAYLICSSSNETKKGEKLLSASAQQVDSALSGLRLARLVLELVALGLCKTVKDVYDTIMEETLLATQVRD